MKLIRKIVSIIVHILLVLAVVAGVGCFVYSYIAEKAADALGQTGMSLDSIVSTLQEASSSAVSSLRDGASGSGTSSSGSSGAAAATISQYASQVADAFGLASSSGQTSSSFSDPTQGEEYLQWKNEIDSPVERVFENTSITAELIEGIAGGSISATQTLVQISDADLTTISSNAASLSTTAAYHTIPSDLPEDVRSLMHEADTHCQNFCTQVQAMVTAARDLKAGNLSAASSLTSAAGAANSELKSMDAAMTSAEELLGVS